MTLRVHPVESLSYSGRPEEPAILISWLLLGIHSTYVDSISFDFHYKYMNAWDAVWSRVYKTVYHVNFRNEQRLIDLALNP